MTLYNTSRPPTTSINAKFRHSATRRCCNNAPLTGKWHAAYLIAAIAMTLSALEARVIYYFVGLPFDKISTDKARRAVPLQQQSFLSSFLPWFELTTFCFTIQPCINQNTKTENKSHFFLTRTQPTSSQLHPFGKRRFSCYSFLFIRLVAE